MMAGVFRISMNTEEQFSQLDSLQCSPVFLSVSYKICLHKVQTLATNLTISLFLTFQICLLPNSVSFFMRIFPKLVYSLDPPLHHPSDHGNQDLGKTGDEIKHIEFSTLSFLCVVY